MKSSLLLLLALFLVQALPPGLSGPVSAQAQGGALTPHGPIHIIGDDNFATANGVTSGSGTSSDPYIIENLVISASTAHGIWIENTTAYFIIRNCLVENGRYFYSGIYLSNVINGKIENNTCSNNFDGICLYSSPNNNTLSNNTCSNNTRHGIYLLSSSNYNTLTNNTCENNSYGIYLYSSSNNTLFNNTCENNRHGIYLEKSSNYNTLTNNTCENNNYSGIYLNYSSNNTLTNNTCENNSDGIFLSFSSYDTLTNNTCENNRWNFSVDGYYISNFDHNIDTSNLVDGRPIYYLKDHSDLVIGPSLNPGYLGLVRCDNIRVENLVLENNGQGIRLASTKNSSIENCVFSNNIFTGIFLSFSSNYNILSNNTCENNSYGIHLRSSSNNNLTNNTCSNSGYFSIDLDSWSDNNNLTNNTCSNNTTGIDLVLSSNNTLSNNTCENNFSSGICLNYSSNNNTITLNHLLNNTTNNAYDEGANYWDNNGKGNYWDDWQPDMNNLTDSDHNGIVDNARPIAGGTNQDDYPLVLPIVISTTTTTNTGTTTSPTQTGLTATPTEPWPVILAFICTAVVIIATIAVKMRR